MSLNNADHSLQRSKSSGRFRSESKISDLLLEKDWSKTELGAPETWSHALNVSLGVCLASKVPYALYWGPDLNLIYNDAFRQIPGDKHPIAFGQKASEVWAEVWSSLGPVMRGVYKTGESVWFEDSHYPLNRSGYLEECYFSFNLSPARGLDGKVEGLVNIVIETTYRVLNERRNRTLQNLATDISSARHIEDVYKLTAQSLASNTSDIPFGVFYSLNDQRSRANLEVTFEIPPDREINLAAFAIGTEGNQSGTAEVIRTKNPKVIDLRPSNCGPILGSAWNEPIRQAVIMPVTKPGEAEVVGILVFGINSRRDLDESYRNFFSLLVGQISNALAFVATLREHSDRQSESNFKTLAEWMPQLCWIAHADGFIFWYNRRWYDYTGANPKDMEGWGWQTVHDPEILPEVMQKWQASIATGSDFEMQFPLKGADGQFRWFLTRGTPIRNVDGKIVKWFGTNTDIEHQKRTEELLEAKVEERTAALKTAQDALVQSAKMTALGEMAGAIAHEINSPLAIIQMKSDQLIGSVESGKTEVSFITQELTKIMTTVDRIAKIIKGLKLFSRSSDSDPMMLTGVSQIIEDTLELCREKFKHYSVDLRLNIEFVGSIDCKPSQLSQVILNLLNNSFDAILHFSEKWIEISVSTSDSIVTIMVADSGRGIAPDIAEKMMLPFYTTKKVGSGTGLGLSISKGIIEGHRGSLCYDLNSKNTRFIVTLPLKQSNQKSRHENP